MRAVKEFIREIIAMAIHPDEHISEIAIALLDRHASTDGLRPIDALIAATTLREDGTLVTANHKYFKNNRLGRPEVRTVNCLTERLPPNGINSEVYRQVQQTRNHIQQ
jgi:hypothetical protein